MRLEEICSGDLSEDESIILLKSRNGLFNEVDSIEKIKREAREVVEILIHGINIFFTRLGVVIGGDEYNEIVPVVSAIGLLTMERLIMECSSHRMLKIVLLNIKPIEKLEKLLCSEEGCVYFIKKINSINSEDNVLEFIKAFD